MNLSCDRFYLNFSIKNMVRYLKIFFLILFFSISFFYFFPFLKIILGERNIGGVTMEVVYEKSTKNCESDSSKALALFNFVTSELITPDEKHKPKDASPFDILKDKYAWCDQQSYVLSSLARLANIDGRIIFLYGNDTISRHTVCELKVKGKYRVFCPLFHKVFYTKKMNLAAIKDIQNDNLIDRKISISKGFNFNEKSYYELFSRKIPYKVFNTNKKNPSTENSFGDLYFKKWYSFFGDFGLKPYMYLMYKLSHTSVLDQNRINELLFN